MKLECFNHKKVIVLLIKSQILMSKQKYYTRYKFGRVGSSKMNCEFFKALNYTNGRIGKIQLSFNRKQAFSNSFRCLLIFFKFKSFPFEYLHFKTF